jgi:hypothetical protein
MNERFTNLHLILMGKSSLLVMPSRHKINTLRFMWESLTWEVSMEVYEVVVKAMVSNSFRVIAENQWEATEKAMLMFSNENLAKVLDLKFDIQRDREITG